MNLNAVDGVREGKRVRPMRWCIGGAIECITLIPTRYISVRRTDEVDREGAESWSVCCGCSNSVFEAIVIDVDECSIHVESSCL